MKKQIYYLALLLALTVVFAGNGHCHMSSANYRIPTSVISGGGSPAGSTNFEANSTVGQPTPLIDPSDPTGSGDYNLFPGFWYTLEFEPVDPCEGDFEPDGDVDGSDLATFAADFGRTDCTGPSDCEGDFDNDNDVDGSDLAVFAADFGRTDCP